MMIFPVFFVFSLFLSISYATTKQDFCVADYAAPQGPAGYSCKDPATVTVDDFVCPLVKVPGNISSINKIEFSAASVLTCPGFNGLGVAMARVDFAVGGVFPMHTHRDASELVILIEGRIVVGFIASNNKPYVKTLNKGDTIVFPQGLMHFLVNVGNTPALAYASFGSENPGIQILETALFQNDLLTEIIAKSTLLDTIQIRKLKRLLGGTN